MISSLDRHGYIYTGELSHRGRSEAEGRERGVDFE